MKITDIRTYDRSSHPFRQLLAKEPTERVKGWIAVPAKPRLGIDVRIARFWTSTGARGSGYNRMQWSINPRC